MSLLSKLAGPGVLIALAASVASAADVTPPDSVAKAGKIVFCSDISSPPLEFFDVNNMAVGSDIDIGN